MNNCLYFLLISFIILFITKMNNRVENMSVEGMANQEEETIDDKVNNAVKKIYLADIQAIRNLSKISKELQNGGIEIPGNLTVKGNFNYLPKGTIVAFSGKTAPTGWALCDGKNGTPDLRGRFIYGYGAGSGNTLNGRGGAERHTLSAKEMPKHRHSGTTTSDSHNHSYQARHKRWKVARSCAAICKYSTVGDYGKKNYTTSSDKHNHKMTTNYQGSGSSHNNMPPYHVLSYIMKL